MTASRLRWGVSKTTESLCGNAQKVIASGGTGRVGGFRPVPTVGTVGSAGKVPLSSMKIEKEGYVACKDLGLRGFCLNSVQPGMKIWLFPCLGGLVLQTEPPDLSCCCFLGAGWKLRHVESAGWAGSAAAPYLL